MASSPYVEKRRERRFPVNSEVSMILANKRIIKGVCHNISGSGMLIRAEQSLRLGTRLQLDVQEGRIDFKADAIVMRVEEADGYYWVGLAVNKKIPS